MSGLWCLLIDPMYICMAARFCGPAGLSAMGRELNVQEHGAMLLAEMACGAGVSGRDVLDSIVLVANIARLQLQDK